MSKQVEEWRDIEGYEGLYQVSDWGRVKSLSRSVMGGSWPRKTKERVLKTYLAGMDRDYHYIKLHNDNVVTAFTIHSLVANTFIPNPENKPQIDHISGDKNDNSVWNLRWATQPENQRNPITREKRFNNPKTSTVVYQYTLDGELVNVFPSIREIVRVTGFDRRSIQRCIKGVKRTYKGYIWRDSPL